MREHDPSLCDCLALEVSGGGYVTSSQWQGHTTDGAPVDLVEHDTGPLEITMVGPHRADRRPAPSKRATLLSVIVGRLRPARR